jgi:DNA primase
MHDLAAIKQQYDLASMIEDQTGQHVEYQRKIHCPFHADSTPSFVVYPDGKWHCFGCSKHGDLFDFLCLVWECDLKEAVDRLADGGMAAKVEWTPPKRKPRQAFRPTLDPEFPLKLQDRMGAREFQYWKDRAITLRELIAFKVGWNGRQYSFPHYYRGVLTAIKYRRDDDLFPEIDKYRHAKGSRTAAPYNVDMVLTGIPDRVLIVEAEKCAMYAFRHGLIAVAAPANTWREDWNHLLAYVPDVIIVADNDENEVGMVSANAIKATLRRSRIVVPPVGNDFSDYSLWLHETLGDRRAETEQIAGWLAI